MLISSDTALKLVIQSRANSITRLRVLNVIVIFAVVVTMLTLAFGAFTWPDAPIRQTANGFGGRTGAPYTREDYELFNLWKKSLLVIAPIAFIVNFGAALARKRQHKHRISKTGQ